MTHRVAIWGTGLVGSAVGRRAATHPGLEIVACFAHGAQKVGRDIGAILGIDPIGVIATDRIDEIIAARPDCVLYMTLVWNVDDLCRLLEAGINVISTANFITGKSYGDADQRRLDAAARQGGASLYGTGINPGLANILALAATGAIARVDRIMVREAVDATAYASKDTWVSMGFGGPADAPGLVEQVRQRALVFMDVVEMMADALQVRVERIDFEAEFGTATQDLQLGYMDIAKGTVCGVNMKWLGRVAGETAIELQLIWRLGQAMVPDWKTGGYLVEIEGQPNATLNFHVEGDTSGGGLTTGMNALHAVPAVCAAPPGIVTAAQLPLIVAARCVRA